MALFVWEGFKTAEVESLRPGRNRRALRPPLRPAHPAPLRPGSHGAAVASLLQHLPGSGSPGGDVEAAEGREEYKGVGVRFSRSHK